MPPRAPSRRPVGAAARVTAGTLRQHAVAAEAIARGDLLFALYSGDPPPAEDDQLWLLPDGNEPDAVASTWQREAAAIARPPRRALPRRVRTAYPLDAGALDRIAGMHVWSDRHLSGRLAAGERLHALVVRAWAAPEGPARRRTARRPRTTTSCLPSRTPRSRCSSLASKRRCAGRALTGRRCRARPNAARSCDARRATPRRVPRGRSGPRRARSSGGAITRAARGRSPSSRCSASTRSACGLAGDLPATGPIARALLAAGAPADGEPGDPRDASHHGGQLRRRRRGVRAHRRRRGSRGSSRRRTRAAFPAGRRCCTPRSSG